MKIDAEHDFGERECPGCSCWVAANENRCPICGYEFPAERRNPAHTAAAWLLLALFAVGLAGGWAACCR